MSTVITSKEVGQPSRQAWNAWYGALEEAKWATIAVGRLQVDAERAGIITRPSITHDEYSTLMRARLSSAAESLEAASDILAKVGAMRREPASVKAECRALSEEMVAWAKAVKTGISARVPTYRELDGVRTRLPVEEATVRDSNVYRMNNSVRLDLLVECIPDASLQMRSNDYLPAASMLMRSMRRGATADEIDAIVEDRSKQCEVLTRYESNVGRWIDGNERARRTAEKFVGRRLGRYSSSMLIAASFAAMSDERRTMTRDWASALLVKNRGPEHVAYLDATGAVTLPWSPAPAGEEHAVPSAAERQKLLVEDHSGCQSVADGYEPAGAAGVDRTSGIER